jgi:hypothetical protein
MSQWGLICARFAPSFKVHKLFSLILAFFFLFTVLFPTGAIAASAEKTKLAETSRASIVLLPITGQGISSSELSVFRDALAESFGEIYDVKYGEQTDKIIEEIFKSHSAESLECDESKCYRDVAAALNTSLIGKAMILLKGSDYHISVVVYDVYENKAVMSRTSTCEKCSMGEFETRLKEMASGKVAAKGGGVRWYWWLLGALVLGGAAAASGGGGSSAGSGSGASAGSGTGSGSGTSGTVNLHW